MRSNQQYTCVAGRRQVQKWSLVEGEANEEEFELAPKVTPHLKYSSSRVAGPLSPPPPENPPRS